jgi:hypothetical protein
MANKVTFTSVWARCREHGKLLEPDEEECFDCRIIQRNLAMTPPFDVLCVDSTYGIVDKGKVYEVVWVIRDGREKRDNEIKGYVFAVAKGSGLIPEVFPAEKFIPLKYLAKDGKSDSWSEPSS